MSVSVYLAGTDVKQSISLVNEDGSIIPITSITYRVLNQDEQVLVASSPATDFVVGSGEVTITVPSTANIIAVGNAREIRSVELTCVTNSNTIVFASSYGIELPDPLVTGLNSFQNFALAQLTALDIPNLPAWDAASENERVAALIDAREHIIQLNFSLLNSNVNFGQDQLSHVPEGQYQSQYVARNGLFLFNGNLGLLNSTQFLTLPERFRKALRQAQVVEADNILSGGGIDHNRQLGLIENEIGEMRQKYRDSMPLNLPVCNRALKYLSYYVNFSKRIGRG